MKRLGKLCTAVVLSVTLLAGIFPVSAASLSASSLLMVGDSIMAGWRDTAYGKSDYSNGGGWSARLINNYDMNVTNAAVAGTAFSSVRDVQGKMRIRDELVNNRYFDYDFVLLQGGFNDIFGDDSMGGDKKPVPMGKMTASNCFDASKFNTDTFAGAFEDLLYNAARYFDGKRIGFIVTYQTPYSKRNEATKDTKAYFNLAMQICDKWGVPYLNFNTGSYKQLVWSTPYVTMFYPNNSTKPYFADDIHLNTAGYDMSVGYIADFLRSLSVYHAPKGLVIPTTVAYRYDDPDDPEDEPRQTEIHRVEKTQAQQSPQGGSSAVVTETRKRHTVKTKVITRRTNTESDEDWDKYIEGDDEYFDDDTSDAGGIHWSLPRLSPGEIAILIGAIVLIIGGGTVVLLLVFRKRKNGEDKP